MHDEGEGDEREEGEHEEGVYEDDDEDEVPAEDAHVDDAEEGDEREEGEHEEGDDEDEVEEGNLDLEAIIKELEAELATQKPWLQELALCDVLIKYLTGLLPKEETASEKQAAPAKKANERLANSFAGMKIMKKKDDEEDYFRAQQQTSKKKRKNKKKQAKKAMREKDLVHTFDTLQSSLNLID